MRKDSFDFNRLEPNDSFLLFNDSKFVTDNIEHPIVMYVGKNNNNVDIVNVFGNNVILSAIKDDIKLIVRKGEKKGIRKERGKELKLFRKNKRSEYNIKKEAERRAKNINSLL